MAAKDVRFSDDARARMFKGVNILANAVKVTLDVYKRQVVVLARRVLAGRGGGTGRGQRRGVHHGACHRHLRLHAHAWMAADAHRFLALGNLQFRDAGFLQQLDQLLYLAKDVYKRQARTIAGPPISMFSTASS